MTSAPGDRRSRPFQRFQQANREGSRAACLAVQAGDEPDEVLVTVLLGDAELPVRIACSRAELESHLLRIRGVLDRVRRDPLLLDGGFDASGNYTGRYGTDSPCHRKDRTLLPPDRVAARMNGYLRDLALAGVALRSALFRDPGHQIAFEALRRHTPGGSVVQIWLDRDALWFAVPWAFVYDGPLDPAWRADRVELELFWGYRLVIEQVANCRDPRLQRPAPIIAPGEGLRLRVGTYGFAETESHVGFLHDLATRSRPPLDVEVWAEDTPWETFLRRCDAQFLYFYAHGHTALPRTATDDQVQLLIAAVREFATAPSEQDELSTEAEAARARLREAMGELERSGMWDEHHIRLAAGHIKMEDLRALVLAPGVAPLVFLNMCESAQVFPSLTDGLVAVFLRKGALGVIGTEVAMPPRFADVFGRLLLTRIAHGEPVGPALLALRQDFLQARNPLGFAYTHYGDALARIEPPLIEQRSIRNGHTG